MPRVIFSNKFDFSPTEFKGTSTIAYKKDHEGMVTTECWKAAKAAGKAKLAPKTVAKVEDEPSN